jgi:hypothetical protein
LAIFKISIRNLLAIAFNLVGCTANLLVHMQNHNPLSMC